VDIGREADGVEFLVVMAEGDCHTRPCSCFAYKQCERKLEARSSIQEISAPVLDCQLLVDNLCIVQRFIVEDPKETRGAETRSKED